MIGRDPTRWDAIVLARRRRPKVVAGGGGHGEERLSEHVHAPLLARGVGASVVQVRVVVVVELLEAVSPFDEQEGVSNRRGGERETPGKRPPGVDGPAPPRI
jgi:hypothetical protein